MIVLVLIKSHVLMGQLCFKEDVLKIALQDILSRQCKTKSFVILAIILAKLVRLQALMAAILVGEL